MSQSRKRIEFTWKLSPKQRALFESQARFRVGMMGRRFGKNEVGTACAVDYATQPHKYDFGSDSSPIVWWVAPTYRQAFLYGYQKTIEKLPKQLVNEDETRGSEWGPSRITLVSGAVFEFLSYGNPSGLQGAGVDLIIGDEWAYSDPSIWNQDLRPMLMDSGGGAVLISKPLGENHFYEHYTYGAGEDQPHSAGGNVVDEFDSYHATAYENPFIPDSEVDKAKQTTPEGIFRQEYLADPHAGGTLLTLDMLDTIHIDELEDKYPEVDFRYHVYVDIGVTMDPVKAREDDTDFWACAMVAEHPRFPEAYVLGVARKRGQAPSKAAAWVSGCMEGLPTQQARFEDNQAQSWFLTNLREYGINGIPVTSTRPKKERITYLSVPFDNGNVKLVEHGGVDWSDFRTEWAGFPNSKHDDQLDALEGALRECAFVQTGELVMSGDMYGRDEEDRDGGRGTSREEFYYG